MGVLSDITVVALEQAVAAPFASARLAEAGARVIKIERDSGDFSRNYDQVAKGDSSYFVWINQGKESLTLNIKDPEDLKLLRKIIGQSDVFLQNLAPGAMGRLGLNAEKLRTEFPALITCDISGYGEDPAVSHLKAYDFLIQSESGLVSVSGAPGAPGRIGVSVCDIGAGMTAHAAILEALLLRQKTGEGSALKVSLFDVAAEWMAVPFIHAKYGEGAPKPQGLRHPSIAPYGDFKAKDGSLTVLSIQNEREWAIFCAQVLQMPELTMDERFCNNNRRTANRDELEATINHCFSAYEREELRARLAKAGIAYGAVNSVEELTAHPALRGREILSSGGDKMVIPSSPVVWLDHDRDKLKRPPTIGENSDSIRREFASQE